MFGATLIKENENSDQKKQFEVSLCFDHQSWSTGVGELKSVFSQEILLTKGTNCKHLTCALTLEKKP